MADALSEHLQHLLREVRQNALVPRAASNRNDDLAYRTVAYFEARCSLPVRGGLRPLDWSYVLTGGFCHCGARMRLAPFVGWRSSQSMWFGSAEAKHFLPDGRSQRSVDACCGFS